MLRQTFGGWLLSFLIISQSLAQDYLGVFYEQKSEDNFPHKKENYFATLAPMPKETSGYLGLSLGLGKTSNQVQAKIDDQTDKQDDNHLFSYHPGIFLGYGKNFQHLYWGLETGLEYNTKHSSKYKFKANTNSEEIEVNLETKQPVSMFIDLIPGYLLRNRDMLFYGRIGLGISLFDLSFSRNQITTNNTQNVSGEAKKFNFGLRLGAGVKYFISRIFALSLEYTHNQYLKTERSFEDNYNFLHSYTWKNSRNQQVKVIISLNF